MLTDTELLINIAAQLIQTERDLNAPGLTREEFTQHKQIWDTVIRQITGVQQRLIRRYPRYPYYHFGYFPEAPEPEETEDTE